MKKNPRVKKNPHTEANRSLDEARDCFLKAAFHLTEPNRYLDGVAEALLYGARGMLKLAAGDLSKRAKRRAENVLREARRTT